MRSTSVDGSPEDVEGFSDEEFVATRDKFRGTITKLISDLIRVQKEIALGRHGNQQPDLEN